MYNKAHSLIGFNVVGIGVILGRYLVVIFAFGRCCLRKFTKGDSLKTA